jgi:hypothetical protein
MSNNTARDKDAAAYFRNLSRLLEMYRFDALRRTAPRAVLDRRKADVRTLLRERADNDAVERALTAAHQSVYAGVEREEFVRHLKGLFELVSKQGTTEIPAADLQRLRRFLSHFAAALKNQ